MTLYDEKLKTTIRNLGFGDFQDILKMTPAENPDILRFTEKFPSAGSGQDFNVEYLFFLETGKLHFEKLGLLAASLVKWEPVFDEYVHLSVQAASAVFHRRNGGFKNRHEIIGLFQNRQDLIADQLRMLKIADEIRGARHHSLLKRI